MMDTTPATPLHIPSPIQDLPTIKYMKFSTTNTGVIPSPIVQKENTISKSEEVNDPTPEEDLNFNHFQGIHNYDILCNPYYRAIFHW